MSSEMPVIVVKPIRCCCDVGAGLVNMIIEMLSEETAKTSKFHISTRLTNLCFGLWFHSLEHFLMARYLRYLLTASLDDSDYGIRAELVFSHSYFPFRRLAIALSWSDSALLHSDSFGRWQACNRPVVVLNEVQAIVNTFGDGTTCSTANLFHLTSYRDSPKDRPAWYETDARNLNFGNFYSRKIQTSIKWGNSSGN